MANSYKPITITVMDGSGLRVVQSNVTKSEGLLYQQQHRRKKNSLK